MLSQISICAFWAGMAMFAATGLAFPVPDADPRSAQFPKDSDYAQPQWLPQTILSNYGQPPTNSLVATASKVHSTAAKVDEAAYLISLAVRAQDEEGLREISSPSIVTIAGREADFLSGGELAIPGSPQNEKLPCGISFKVLLGPREGERVQLRASWGSSEAVALPDAENMVMTSGLAFQLAGKVRLNQPTKLVMEKNSQGEPTLWAEIKVSALERTAAKPVHPLPPQPKVSARRASKYQ